METDKRDFKEDSFKFCKEVMENKNHKGERKKKKKMSELFVIKKGKSNKKKNK